MKKNYRPLIIEKILFIFLSFVFTSCAAMFQQKIDMDSEVTSTTLSDLILSQKKISKLEAPEQVFASQSLYSSKIKVTWSLVNNAASYRLERAVISQNQDGSWSLPQEEDFSVIKLSGYNTAFLWTTSFTDTISSPDYTKRYYYRVSAENNEKGYEASSYSLSNQGSLFSPPLNAKAEGGISSTSIKVTWDKTENASKYEIYKTTSSNGSSSEKVGEVTSNLSSFTDLVDSEYQGTEFYYKVYATNSAGERSESSNLAMGYTLIEGAPSQVKNVRITKGRGSSTSSISVSWDPSSGSSGIQYALYRTNSSDSTLILVKDKLTETSYTDTSSLKSNLYYYYLVQAWAYDSEGQKLKAAFSDSGSSSENPAEGYLLSPPTSLSAEKSGSSLIIYFAPAIGNDEEKLTMTYNIYGCTTEDFSNPEFVESVLGYSDLNASGLYKITLPVTGANYFKIRTQNTEGIESSWSEIFAPSPFAVEEVSVTKNDNPHKYEGKENSQGVYPVTVSWAAPDDTAVYGYYVYRANSASSSYRKINDTMIPSDTLYYIDENSTAKAGTVYFYKVLTVNTLGQGTNYSQPDWGYGSLTADQYMREYNKTIKTSQAKLTLMHKSGNTDKLGSETINGNFSGTLSYNASVTGSLSGRVIMKYTSYADLMAHEGGIIDSSALSSDEIIIGNAGGYYFKMEGNTNTSAGMSGEGSMDGTMTSIGMYPGIVVYDKIDIKNSNAGGGVYLITRRSLDNENYDSSPVEVSYLVGNE